jgi:hypothetical protein
MNTPHPYQKIALFLLGLVAVFAASAALGSTFEPAATEADETEETMEAHATDETTHGTAHEPAAHEPAGLEVSSDGYSLRMSPSQLERRQARELRFTVETDGEAVTDFDELHERRLHLIVVRRDGAGFRHLHPEMDAAGTWTVPIEFGEAGVYRAFADFSVEGEQQTIATDLFVSGGEFEAPPFPAPEPVDETHGYEVRLEAADPVAGERSELRFTVSRHGRPVEDLTPYLGAKGHLVALREGDLAFLHVHPEEGQELAAEEIEFAATFPTPGSYHLYLQFRHEGTVRTAEFTVVAR